MLYTKLDDERHWSTVQNLGQDYIYVNTRINEFSYTNIQQIHVKFTQALR